MNVFYTVVGLVVATVIFLIYDRQVTKETKRIFNEMQRQVDEWKRRAMENDKDD